MYMSNFHKVSVTWQSVANTFQYNRYITEPFVNTTLTVETLYC